MRVIIAGSRTINDPLLIDKAVVQSGFDITEVISGAALGADRLGEQWAIKRGIPIQVFPADWKTHGKGAGYIRNGQMGKFADAAIVIWNGQSKGSKHMIDVMKTMNKPVYVLVV